MKKLFGVACAVLVLALASQAADDILVNDFEGTDYGDWKVEGDCFGKAPAKGTLASQHAVIGFKGKGLVNTFLNGDKTTGTLTSSPLKVERNFITFLIGGGAHTD